MPERQLVKPTASIAAVQVNRRIIGPLALERHTISPTTHVHIVLDAGAESGVQRVRQATAYRKSSERQRGWGIAMFAAAWENAEDQQHGTVIFPTWRGGHQEK